MFPYVLVSIHVLYVNLLEQRDANIFENLMFRGSPYEHLCQGACFIINMEEVMEQVRFSVHQFRLWGV